MFEAEDTLWWYRGLRLYLADAFLRARLPPEASVLDAGCGSGANMVLISNTWARVAGCDLAEEAVALARARGPKRVFVADVNALPFRDGAFDCVLSADVFEAREVDEPRAVAELARVTRRGGQIIVVVAAYQFLLSAHDRAVHSVRRYTKTRARRAFAIPGLEVVRARYLFGVFLLPIVIFRLVRRLRPVASRGTGPRSDLFTPPAPVNSLLYSLVILERLVARLIPIPFGTTILLELRRESAAPRCGALAEGRARAPTRHSTPRAGG